jgi:hypothetical protein
MSICHVLASSATVTDCHYCILYRIDCNINYASMRRWGRDTGSRNPNNIRKVSHDAESPARSIPSQLSPVFPDSPRAGFQAFSGRALVCRSKCRRISRLGSRMLREHRSSSCRSGQGRLCILFAAIGPAATRQYIGYATRQYVGATRH